MFYLPARVTPLWVAPFLCICCAVGAADFESGRRAYSAGNYALALSHFQPLAQSGDARSQLALGMMYERGEGLVQSYKNAALWFERAALQGEAAAKVRLGYLYQNGRGVPKNAAEAIRLYREAAEAGDSDGQYVIGLLLERGLDGEEGKRTAYEWMIKAAARGHEDANRWLEQKAAKGNREALAWQESEGSSQGGMTNLAGTGATGREAADRKTARELALEELIVEVKEEMEKVERTYARRIRSIKKSGDPRFAFAQLKVAVSGLNREQCELRRTLYRYENLLSVERGQEPVRPEVSCKVKSRSGALVSDDRRVLLESSCSFNTDCDVGQMCVKASYAMRGRCMRPVDRDGFRTLRPLPGDEFERCFDTLDCPIGFQCDRNLKVCVK